MMICYKKMTMFTLVLERQYLVVVPAGPLSFQLPIVSSAYDDLLSQDDQSL